MLNNYDLVVSMAEEPFRPDFLMEDKKVIWWEVANPDTMTQQIAEDTFKQLQNLILDLTETHGIPLCR
jgi:protein-tyrosine-phosphatase